jgi:PncC family amidohydrolase
MQELLPIAERIGARLKARGETVAVFEGSTGGLVSAALLSVAGASNYFVGGGVIYTRPARAELARVQEAELAGMRASTEPYALLLARKARTTLGTTWGIGESGATGPTGNRYGDAAGHCCFAVAGPTERAVKWETGNNDRVANMRRFAKEVLQLLEKSLD